MKRTILSLTTAIALAAPAFAQTGVEETVVDVLTQNGYPASSIEMLSQGQIAELYVVSTSEGAGDVSTVIASFDLPSDEGSDVLATSPAATDVEMTVASVLAENGYSADTVNALSGGEIANIYVASTSGSQTDVESAIASAIEVSTTMPSENPSMAAERAIDYLMRKGYSAAEIEAIDQTELLAIYVALTSGEQTDIDEAVESAVSS
ncbi:hypothetical protein P6F26_17890 [Roseibacterium sp. SDUM158017]|uniref:hypothetical protein n=1 Tax=Roseicyclus salinarum TaxID=3036773 RepID=UPI002414FE8E|nr:hypothetical protein [Roseibacterium sp. SDUM158017]MDG4650322.1 hypothetical protein [Roseibacterium sp. SDUM158017]